MLLFARTCGYLVVERCARLLSNKNRTREKNASIVYVITFFFIWGFWSYSITSSIGMCFDQQQIAHSKLHPQNGVGAKYYKENSKRQTIFTECTSCKHYKLVKFSLKMVFFFCLPKSNQFCAYRCGVSMCASQNTCVDKSSPLFPIVQCSFWVKYTSFVACLIVTFFDYFLNCFLSSIRDALRIQAKNRSCLARRM